MRRVLPAPVRPVIVSIFYVNESAVNGRCLLQTCKKNLLEFKLSKQNDSFTLISVQTSGSPSWIFFRYSKSGVLTSIFLRIGVIVFTENKENTEIHTESERLFFKHCTCLLYGRVWLLIIELLMKSYYGVRKIPRRDDPVNQSWVVFNDISWKGVFENFSTMFHCIKGDARAFQAWRRWQRFPLSLGHPTGVT